MRILLLAAMALAVMAGSALAGKQVKYLGIHPVAKAQGGGFCYIEGPHVHTYAADNVQYRDHRGHKHFVGDPVAYGYDGPKHAYKGHHPIEIDANVDAELDASLDADVDANAGIRIGEPHGNNAPPTGRRPRVPHTEFCYLDGPHYHYFVPVDGPDFKVVGGVYFYVGTPPKVYVDARPVMIKINAIYTPIVYARPVVTIEAPVGWIGARAEFITPVVVAPRVDARVIVPAPSIRVDIGIGVPGVIIHDHHHHGRGRHKHKKHKKWR